MKQVKKDQYLYDIGFVYELYSNISKYKVLKQDVLKDSSVKNSKIKKYIEDCLDGYKLNLNSIQNDLYRKYRKEIDNGIKRLEYDKLCEQASWYGYLQGGRMLKDMIKNVNEKHSEIVDLVYFQTDFINPVKMDKHRGEPEDNYYKELINTFFDYKMTEEEIKKYSSKGCFLNADCIVGLLDKEENLHLFVVDNKIDLTYLQDSSLNAEGAIEALNNLAGVKNRRVQFRNIMADTESAGLDFNITNSLLKYASIAKDNNMLKVIQAGSYASSFLNFLDNADLMSKFKNVYISLVADIGTDVCIINLSDKNTDEIRKMRKAYADYDRDMSRNEKTKIIKKSVRLLVQNLSNSDNKKNMNEFDKILNLKENEFAYTCIEETFDDFIPTTEGEVNMQHQHSDKLKEFLENRDELLCLLPGCPGIGKTFGFKNSTKNLEKEVSFYFSPRNAINDDFYQSYLSGEVVEVESNGKTDTISLVKENDRIIITARSTDEKIIDGENVQVINYLTNNDKNLPKPKGNKSDLTFLKLNREINYEEEKDRFIVDECKNEITRDSTEKNGVMSRISQAVTRCIYDADEINKITVFSTIQSQKSKGFNKNTTDALKSILAGIIKKGAIMETVDNKKFEEFISKCPNLFFMIDEITGSSEGVSLFEDIYDIFVTNFYNKLNNKQKEKLNLKIIVADASLVNKDVMEKHLFKSEKIEQDKIYFLPICSRPEPLASTELLEIKQKYNNKTQNIRARVINANAYPAKKINMKYHNFVKSCSLNVKDNNSIARNKLNQAKKNLKDTIDEDIVNRAIDDIVDKKYPQTIIFVQDKKRIGNLIELLKKNWSEKDKDTSLPIVLTTNKHYLVLDADMTASQRAEAISNINSEANTKREYNEHGYPVNELKFVFMTSTASRGISFKLTQSLHILLQNFQVENYLMEFIQAIYRPRGDAKNDAILEKDINCYQHHFLVTTKEEEDYGSNDMSEFEYRKNRTILTLISYITLVRSAINTRIKGYTTLNKKDYALVSVGGKYVNSVSKSVLDDVSNYQKLLGKELDKICTGNDGTYMDSDGQKHKFKDLIEQIKELIRDVFNSLDVHTQGCIYNTDLNMGDIYSNFLKQIKNNSLKSYLEAKDIFNEYMFINGLLVFSMSNAKQKIVDETTFCVTLKDKRRELLLSLKELDKHLPYQRNELKQSTNELINLINTELNRDKMDTVGYFEREFNRNNRYIAIPAVAFVHYKDFINYNYSEQYLSGKQGQSDDDIINVIDVLKNSINQYTRVNSVLPIVSDFTGFIPFITFKSDNLSSIYNSSFNKNYMITSTETNIFNLMMLNDK